MRILTAIIAAGLVVGLSSGAFLNAEAALPDGAYLAELRAGITAWNVAYAEGSGVSLIEALPAGAVLTAAHRDLVVELIVNGWTPDGDVSDAASFRTVKLGDAREQISDTAWARWSTLVEDEVDIGDRLFTLLVQRETGEVVEVVGVADANGGSVNVDSFFPNVGFEHEGGSPNADTAAATLFSGVPASSGGAAGCDGNCHNVKFTWGLGFKGRGSYQSSIDAMCTPQGTVRHCLPDCDGFYQMGSIDYDCVVTPGEQCCVMESAYAWKTVTGDASVEAKYAKNGAFLGFSITISGIGSGGKGNKVCVACCDEDGGGSQR